MGEDEILVCSFESVRIGTNLDQAGAIHCVDSSIKDVEYKQAIARISRCGTKHSELTATFVVVDGTLSKDIYDYHEDRRQGIARASPSRRPPRASSRTTPTTL